MTAAGIILAAGESRRMGRPKALLPLGGRTFLRTIADGMREAGLDRVLAVVGADRETIVRGSLEAGVAGVEWVVNETWERGQLSSLWCGLEALDKEDAVVMTLVDHPAVGTATYRILIEELKKQPESIVVPVYEGRRGHPMAFGRARVADFLGAPLEEGARWVLRQEGTPVREVRVADPGVRTDIDTPDAWRRADGKEPDA